MLSPIGKSGIQEADSDLGYRTERLLVEDWRP